MCEQAPLHRSMLYFFACILRIAPFAASSAIRSHWACCLTRLGNPLRRSGGGVQQWSCFSFFFCSLAGWRGVSCSTGDFLIWRSNECHKFMAKCSRLESRFWTVFRGIGFVSIRLDCWPVICPIVCVAMFLLLFPRGQVVRFFVPGTGYIECREQGSTSEVVKWKVEFWHLSDPGTPKEYISPSIVLFCFRLWHHHFNHRLMLE